MRLLADENFPLPTIEALRQAGHDVTWARTDCPGTPAIPENVTPLVLRTVGADEGWGGHASVVTVDCMLMVRSGNPGTR